MDLHLLQSINDLQSIKVTDEITTCWKCSKKLPRESERHNESVLKSIESSFRLSNVLMILSLNAGCLTCDQSFDAEVLKSLIKILLDSEMSSNDKEPTINLLAKHAQLHSSCCTSLTDTYHNLIEEQLEEFEFQTILQKILNDIENMLLKDQTAVLNTRLSRISRKKKNSDDFYYEDEIASKRQKRSADKDVIDSLEITENNPWFRFVALKFIAEIISHEFYSKCSNSEDKNIFRKTMAGNMFLTFNEFEVKLEEKLVGRCIEIYKRCDDSNREPVGEIIELIANTCLFADSGKLSVCGDIMCNKQYPLSQLFCQFFIQSVFKRTSSSEANVILKNVKPPWLRLNCAHSVLKRAGYSKGLPTLFEKLEKCLDEASSTKSDPESSDISKSQMETKMYNSLFQKFNEEVVLILMNIFDAATKTYRLRELQSLYEINKKKNVTTDTCASNYEGLVREFEYYVQFKNIVSRILNEIQNSPTYVNRLKFI